MRRDWMIRGVVLCLLLTTSCQAEPTPTPVPVASPTAEATTRLTRKTRVVLIALDGANPGLTATYMEDGTMPNLAHLAERGVAAAFLQTVDPAMAAPSYHSLSMGTFPSDTGWIAEMPPTAGTAFLGGTEWQGQPMAALETVWRTAMRNGLKAATVFWPGASLDVLNLQANYVVEVAESHVPSAQHVISLQEAEGWRAVPVSLSPLQEGLLHITSDEGGTLATFHVLAADLPDEGAGVYDLLILDSDKDLQNGHTAVSLGEWASLVVSPRLHSGADFCFTASEGLTVTVYQSRVSYNRGRPAELLRGVNEVGFPPPAPDLDALHQGWLSANLYYEMAELRARWMMDVVLYVYRMYQPDLLLTAQDVIAECTRAFLLIDERQQGYDSETAEQYAAFLQEAHGVADEHLGRLLSLVNIADSVVLALSGHGLGPVHTLVRINTILEDAGLLHLETDQEGDRIDVNESQAVALASGGSAHIYINLQGRDRPGIVVPEDYEQVQQQIIQALAEIEDEDGQPVFVRTLTRQELVGIHLHSPNSGDVFVQTAPGYGLVDTLGLEEVLAESPVRAEGGLDATLPQMHGIFIATGDNLVRGKTISAVHITNIAPTIAKVLHFEPAPTVSGHAIEDIWR